MFCHMKYIFVWIFLTPQPTGYVFMWDFVLIFSLFTFFFRIELDRFIFRCTLFR